MTCIVGYRDGKNVWIGGDSIGSNGHYKAERKDTKVFRRNEMIMGYTSSFRMGQLLKWKLNIPKQKSNEGTERYMNTSFVDAVITCFEQNGYARVKENEKIGGVFIVGYRKRLFTIDSDFQVEENKHKFHACGSGAICATGAIEALSNYDPKLKPELLIRYSIEAAKKYIVSVGGAIKIIKL